MYRGTDITINGHVQGKDITINGMYRGQTLQLRGMYIYLKVNFNFVQGHSDTQTDKATLWIIELLTSQLKTMTDIFFLIF